MGCLLAEAQWTFASQPVRLRGIGASDPARLQVPAALGVFLQAARGRTGVLLDRFLSDFGELLSRVERSLPELAGPLKYLWDQGSLTSAVACPLIYTWASQ